MRSDAETLVAELRDNMAQLADPEKAEAQRAYMKSALPYYGISSPDLKAILKQPLSRLRLTEQAAWERAIRTLWDTAQHREEWYAALAIARHRYYRAWREDLASLDLYAYMIKTGAWWDVCDEIAQHLVAPLLAKHPADLTPVMRRWAEDDRLWIRRVAVQSQLGRRADTDTALLSAVIEPNLGDREFWMRKAIGWALRDYAKTDPRWVWAFVEQHADRMSGLSRREALKHIGE